MKNVTAAGIIIFRNVNNIPVFLGLEALPRFRKKGKGKYDIPKGGIDQGEAPFAAAKRECLEETGLTPLRIIAGPFVDGPLVVWLGETDEEIVSIGDNPKTGEKEHVGYKWMNSPDLKKTCLSYLKPSIQWAESETLDYLNIY